MKQIYYGVISEVKGDKARVTAGGFTTDFLPVFQTASEFKRVWVPLRLKEQCIVLAPSGDINTGCILRGIYYSAHPAPSTDEETELTCYSDGTEISYNTESSELKINASKDITIICDKVSVSCKDASVKADTVQVKADKVQVDSPLIDLGVGGAGVVTGECICMLSGVPHAYSSEKVKAVK